MSRYENVLEAIGRTPLIRLSRVTAGLGVTVLAKAECLNPGGSIKDRIGLAMIEDAEKCGLLRPGGTIIEATAGNTGVGLAMVAAVKGYRCIFVMPKKMSEDKRSLLRAFGAEVVITPTSVQPDSPESYNGVADRLGREIPGAFRPSQFANPLNPEAHYRTTGPQIWQTPRARPLGFPFPSAPRTSKEAAGTARPRLRRFAVAISEGMMCECLGSPRNNPRR